jgi:hypothetical protein
MTALTPEEATATWFCPLARTFAYKVAQEGCRGDECACWRWEPIAADDPRFTAAKATALAILGGGASKHKEAVAMVMANREAYGVPTKPERGFCGIGGRP